MRKFLPLVASIPALIVYLLTTCRNIWIGDSAEFALVLKCFGIAHPPGYPLFTLLGTLFVQALAFLRPLLAGGVFASCAAAAAVGALYLLLKKHVDEYIALGLALGWAFTPIFWGETNGVEIYTLNILLVTLVYLALQSDSRVKWPLTVYLFGLSLCNHPSALSLAPAILYRFIAEGEFRRFSRLPLYVGLLGVAGAMYFVLPLRSQFNSISDWGNPESLDALWRHMSLKQYSGWVGNSWGNVIHSAYLYGRTLIGCWSWLGPVLVVSGTLLGLRRQRSRTVMALLILVTSVFMAAYHQAVNYDPFYLIPLFASMILILPNFEQFAQQTGRLRGARAAVIAAALLLLIFNFKSNDKSHYTLYEDYSRALLDSAVPNSTVFVAGDINAFGPIYLRYAEGFRSDLRVYDRSIRKTAMLERASQLAGNSITELLPARNIILEREQGRRYLAKNHYQNDPEWWQAFDSLRTFGLLYDIQIPQDPLPTVPAYPASFVGGDLMSSELLVNLDLVKAEEYLLKQPPDSAAALRQLQLALGRYDNEPRGVLLNQLGIFCRKLGEGDVALECYRRALTTPILTSQQKADIEFSMSNVFKDRANAAMSRSDYRTAAVEFEQALAFDRKNTRVLLNLALIYEQQLFDRRKALVYFGRYLELVPEDTRVRDMVNNLR